MRTRALFQIGVISLLFLSSTASSEAEPPQAASLQPGDWNAELRLPEARDLNPDPNIVEINLEARIATVDIAGRKAQVWTYDGGIPGPLIRGNVGDRLIVHFTNKLPDPTTVHWHGVRVPIQMDGVPEISQPEVQSGESFTYDFTLRDAGLYWYHPHVDSAKQVGFGLSGPLLVSDPSENVGVGDEMVLALNDIELDEKGELASPDSGGTAAMAFGREGNIVLVNGKANARIAARAGAPQRWRVVNMAKTRYFNLHLRDAGSILTKIGGDDGLMEYPTKGDLIVLAPGERADLIVTPKGKPGSEIEVMSELYNRGYGSIEFRLPEILFRIALTNAPVYVAKPLPQIKRTIEPLSALNATPISLVLEIIRNNDRTNEYRINGKPFWRAKPIQASLGETQLWTVTNNTDWSHPMHIHGFFFQVLDKDGQPKRPLQWKDTVDVPLRQTVRLLVKFDERPGQWMVHCHILDHAEGGLMTTVQVGEGPLTEHSHRTPGY